MPTTRVLEYEGDISEDFPVTEEMLDKFVRNLTSSATLLYNRLSEKISDAEAYQRELVESSIRAYYGVLNPTYISKSQRNIDQMRDTHGKNLADSYTKWRDSLKHAFETVDGVEAKRFKDKVVVSKDACKKAWSKKGMRLSGDKIRQRGPATIGSYLLVGEPRSVGWIKPGDKFFGDPFNIVRPGLEPFFQAAFVGRVVQAAVLILNRDFNTAEFTYQNNLTNSLVQGLINPILGLSPFGGPDSFVNLEKQGSLFILHIKVSRV